MVRELDRRLRVQRELARTLSSVELFSARVLRRPLRGYQLAPARAVLDSVLQGRGLTFAVMMARQAGKNEISAHLEALLLNLHRRRGGTLVKASPTFQPQALQSMQRLRAVWQGSLLPPLAAERGNLLRAGRAGALFLSAGLHAHVVGATAGILLEGDEAQDIDEDKWNRDFRPMAASTDATTVLWGTAWTSNTLLARTIRALRHAEGRDQVQRVFIVPWEQVAAESPAYGRYVRGEIERLGRNHPLIRTQYYLEEIDEEGGMFSPATRVLMRGSHERQRGPTEGREYALLVDVAGEAEERDEQSLLREEPTRRDSTALTVVEVARDGLGQPRFLVMDRYHWTGTPHHTLYGAITHLADLWGAVHVVVDGTGVGAGLVSFLKRALGERVHPFIFTARSKSDLGWEFLGICNSGRFFDYRDDGGPEQRQFWREVEAADYAVVDGPGRLMRWGVADPTVHDDLLISAALCATLEGSAGGRHQPAQVIDARDSLWTSEKEAEDDGD
ncbi:MAG: hypothetical protein ACYC4R_02910 [Anaerolineae bacterium]